MPDLQINLSLIDFIQPYLFYIFCGISLVNAIWLFGHYSEGNQLFSFWNKKLLSLNEESDELTHEELEEVKSEAVSHPLVSEMINRISEISKKSEGLTVVEIHEIVDPTINSFESKLNQGASNFIILGLFFTVLGLLTGLFNLQEGFSADSIQLMLKNLQVSFSTTIFGLLFAMAPKAGQFSIEKASHIFRYNFVLFARNKLIPHYSIRKTEKDLGEVVRQIQRSSSELKKAAESVIQLSQNTELSTSRVEAAVQGFSEITAKMKEREDNLIKNMSQISSNLAATKSGMENTFIPIIEQLKHDLLNRDTKMESSFQALTSVQNSQASLNNHIKDALAEIVKANDQIGKFFNEKFEGAFKESMDQLNETYEQKIETIVTGLNALSQTVDDNNQASEIQQNDHYNNVKTTLENLLDEVKQKVDSYKFPSEEIKNELAGLKNDFSTSREQNINRFKDLEIKNNQFLEKIEALHGTVQKVSTEIRVIKKDNIEKIITDISNLGLQLKGIEGELKSIRKLAKGKDKGGLRRLFG